LSDKLGKTIHLKHAYSEINKESFNIYNNITLLHLLYK